MVLSSITSLYSSLEVFGSGQNLLRSSCRESRLNLGGDIYSSISLSFLTLHCQAHSVAQSALGTSGGGRKKNISYVQLFLQSSEETGCYDRSLLRRVDQPKGSCWKEKNKGTWKTLSERLNPRNERSLPYPFLSDKRNITNIVY